MEGIVVTLGRQGQPHRKFRCAPLGCEKRKTPLVKNRLCGRLGYERLALGCPPEQAHQRLRGPGHAVDRNDGAAKFSAKTMGIICGMAHKFSGFLSRDVPETCFTEDVQGIPLMLPKALTMPTCGDSVVLISMGWHSIPSKIERSISLKRVSR